MRLRHLHLLQRQFPLHPQSPLHLLPQLKLHPLLLPLRQLRSHLHLSQR